MLAAQAVFYGALIALGRCTEPSCPVRSTEPPCNSNMAAVGSRAGRFVFGMLSTLSFLSCCCVGCASPGCADPMRAVLGANTFARDKGGAAVGMSAGYLLAVLPTIAAPLQSVGYAPHLNTLAACSVFAAQASRPHFGDAAFDRAWLQAVALA